VKLALNMGYWGMGGDADNLSLAQAAEDLGFASAWVAEAYGSDAVSVLAWVGARTSRIGLGSAIMQIPARTPAMTAMTAATLDTLSGGRVLLGLGVSGPQVSEGWHGVRFDKPLARTREYVEVVRLALSRQKVRYAGQHYTLPLPDGPGKAIQLTVHPVREHIPVYLAAIGPKNLELTGEIADGVLSVFFDSLDGSSEVIQHLATGRAKVGKTMDGFDVVASMPLVLDENDEAAMGYIRAYYALYIGGMGSREKNFYNQLAGRLGYAEEAKAIQDLYMARDYAGAQEAVPSGFIERTALIGDRERIAARMAKFAAAGVTTMAVMPAAASLEQKIATLGVAAEALQLSGVAE
jgi:F420-dependent oxidoreductase-like protein